MVVNVTPASLLIDMLATGTWLAKFTVEPVATCTYMTPTKSCVHATPTPPATGAVDTEELASDSSNAGTAVENEKDEPVNDPCVAINVPPSAVPTYATKTEASGASLTLHTPNVLVSSTVSAVSQSDDAVPSPASPFAVCTRMTDPAPEVTVHTNGNCGRQTTTTNNTHILKSVAPEKQQHTPISAHSRTLVLLARCADASLNVGADAGLTATHASPEPVCVAYLSELVLVSVNATADTPLTCCTELSLPPAATNVLDHVSGTPSPVVVAGENACNVESASSCAVTTTAPAPSSTTDGRGPYPSPRE